MISYLVDPTISRMLPPELKPRSETAKQCCVSDGGITNLITNNHKRWRKVVKRATFHIHFSDSKQLCREPCRKLSAWIDRPCCMSQMVGTGFVLLVGSRFTCKTVQAWRSCKGTQNQEEGAVLIFNEMQPCFAY